MKALKTFIKPLWGTTKKCENKNLINFFSSSSIGKGSVNLTTKYKDSTCFGQTGDQKSQDVGPSSQNTISSCCINPF